MSRHSRLSKRFASSDLSPECLRKLLLGIHTLSKRQHSLHNEVDQRTQQWENAREGYIGIKGPNLSPNTGGYQESSTQPDSSKSRPEIDEMWVKNGMVSPKDWEDQLRLLEENEKLQYDPDDPFGRRLPRGHPGRNIPHSNPLKEYTLVERYRGRARNLEKKEWNHFHKALNLHSAPNFPELQQSAGEKSDERGQKLAPLYMPNKDHYIPTWTQQQRISKLYGPSYSHYISLPAVTLPKSEVVFRARKQRQRERNQRKLASHSFSKLKRTSDEELQVLLDEYVSEMEETKGGVGLLSQWASTDALLNRRLEKWDKRVCQKLRHEGDPNLNQKVKERVFNIYLDSIDKNNTLAPWQKNLAFNLMPKAIGGPWGKLSSELDTGPKEKKSEYGAHVGGREAAPVLKDEEDELDDLGL